MVEAGIMAEDERVELLGGEFYEMAPIGLRHVRAVRVLNDLLNEHIRRVAVIDVQNPILLNDKSRPQPDVIVLHRRDYPGYPSPADVFVVIEVADSSLAYDRDVKFPRYAAAGIPEAWLVDLNANVIERYSDPRDGRYRQIFVAGIGDVLSSTTLPDLAIPVAAVVGPTVQP